MRARPRWIFCYPVERHDSSRVSHVFPPRLAKHSLEGSCSTQFTQTGSRLPSKSRGSATPISNAPINLSLSRGRIFATVFCHCRLLVETFDSLCILSFEGRDRKNTRWAFQRSRLKYIVAEAGDGRFLLFPGCERLREGQQRQRSRPV